MAYLIGCLFFMLFLDFVLTARRRRHTSYTGKLDTHY